MKWKERDQKEEFKKRKRRMIKNIKMQQKNTIQN